MVYRKKEAEMPVDKTLVEAGKEEGLRVMFLTAPKACTGTGGRMTNVSMIAMKPGEVDSSECIPRSRRRRRWTTSAIM
jgi:NADPH-dependent glutamate synthase beta subunit-like oxidoreductase